MKQLSTEMTPQEMETEYQRLKALPQPSVKGTIDFSKAIPAKQLPPDLQKQIQNDFVAIFFPPKNKVVNRIRRAFRRLLCPHRWQPVDDIFWGAHSSWDSLFNVKRRWQCCDCGKRIMASHPISYKKD